MVQWMDEVLAQPGLSELVLDALDAESLLAMRLVERRGPGLVAVVFDIVAAKRRLRRYDSELARHLCCKQLILGGELRLLQYARTGPDPFPWSAQTAAAAAQEGFTDILYWMYFEANPPVAPPYRPGDVFRVGYGNQGERDDPPRDSFGIESVAAAMSGRLDTIKWLRKHCFPLTPKVCSVAATAGHLNVLKYTCVLADPGSDWLLQLLRMIHGNRADVAMEYSSVTSEPFRTEYRRRLENWRWLPILQWYWPFAAATERAKMLELVPREWLEEA